MKKEKTSKSKKRACELLFLACLFACFSFLSFQEVAAWEPLHDTSYYQYGSFTDIHSGAQHHHIPAGTDLTHFDIVGNVHDSSINPQIFSPHDINAYYNPNDYKQSYIQTYGPGADGSHLATNKIYTDAVVITDTTQARQDITGLEYEAMAGRLRFDYSRKNSQISGIGYHSQAERFRVTDSMDYAITNTSLQNKSYINHKLEQFAEPDSTKLASFKDRVGPIRESLGLPSSVYRAADTTSSRWSLNGAPSTSNESMVRFSLENSGDNVHFDAGGAFMTPGDNIRGRGSDRLSGIGANSANRTSGFETVTVNRFKMNSPGSTPKLQSQDSLYRLEVGQSGNISPHTARQVFNSNSMAHTTTGVRFDWASENDRLYSSRAHLATNPTNSKTSALWFGGQIQELPNNYQPGRGTESREVAIPGTGGIFGFGAERIKIHQEAEGTHYENYVSIGGNKDTRFSTVTPVVGDTFRRPVEEGAFYTPTGNRELGDNFLNRFNREQINLFGEEGGTIAIADTPGAGGWYVNNRGNRGIALSSPGACASIILHELQHFGFDLVENRKKALSLYDTIFEDRDLEKKFQTYHGVDQRKNPDDAKILMVNEFLSFYLQGLAGDTRLSWQEGALHAAKDNPEIGEAIYDYAKSIGRNQPSFNRNQGLITAFSPASAAIATHSKPSPSARVSNSLVGFLDSAPSAKQAVEKYLGPREFTQLSSDGSKELQAHPTSQSRLNIEGNLRDGTADNNTFLAHGRFSRDLEGAPQVFTKGSQLNVRASRQNPVAIADHSITSSADIRPIWDQGASEAASRNNAALYFKPGQDVNFRIMPQTVDERGLAVQNQDGDFSILRQNLSFAFSRRIESSDLKRINTQEDLVNTLGVSFQVRDDGVPSLDKSDFTSAFLPQEYINYRFREDWLHVYRRSGDIANPDHSQANVFNQNLRTLSQHQGQSSPNLSALKTTNRLDEQGQHDPQVSAVTAAPKPQKVSSPTTPVSSKINNYNPVASSTSTWRENLPNYSENSEFINRWFGR